MRGISSSLCFLGLLRAANASETWSIANLETHFMGPNSGLPGGAWPPGDGFNSTVNFNLHRTADNCTSAIDVKCSANWSEPSYVETWRGCNDTNLKWRFLATKGFSGANFTIELLLPSVSRPADSGNVNTQISISYSTVHISADNRSDPTSYMTCLGGAPLTGIHCSCDSVDNIQLGLGCPITLNTTTETATVPPFQVSNITYTVPLDSSVVGDFQNSISFNVSSSANASDVETCHSSWTSDATANSTARDSPPDSAHPLRCDGSPKSYYHWFDFRKAEPTTNFTLYIAESFSQKTSFTSLDGAEVNVTAVITSSMLLAVGDQLNGNCSDGVCTYQISGDDLQLFVNEYQVAADASYPLGAE